MHEEEEEEELSKYSKGGGIDRIEEDTIHGRGRG